MIEDPVISPSPSAPNAALAPSVRHFGRMNGLGLWTLYVREVRRFIRVGPQTLLAPVVSNMLYMTVFVLAFSQVRGGADPAFVAFLAPGLVMLGILNNASANSSSSIMNGKMNGSIIDILMPPLSATELTLAYVGGSISRGLLVGLATAMGLSLFSLMIPQHIGAVVYFGISAAAMLGMIGILSGIWAEKFDQLSVVNNFVILPLSFLSGTFYHIDILPPLFQKISLFNPLFYLIDGFRYGFIGVADGNIVIGALFVLALNIVLFIACIAVFRSGWRLKA